uniref:Uncharacterized protein n=1 Tax=Salvator merianae TaxID=96440 RepID=A0A8D0BTH0_SALMN
MGRSCSFPLAAPGSHSSGISREGFCLGAGGRDSCLWAGGRDSCLWAGGRDSCLWEQIQERPCTLPSPPLAEAPPPFPCSQATGSVREVLLSSV